MLQSVPSVFVVYRRKTLTGSPDPMHANGTNKSCMGVSLLRGCLPRGVYIPLWTKFLTLACENIAFRATTVADGNETSDRSTARYVFSTECTKLENDQLETACKSFQVGIGNCELWQR